MDFDKLYKDGEYEKIIREIDDRFGRCSEELGRNRYTKEKAEWCIKQVRHGE